jgi:dephospho-CoA kinase
MALHPVHKGSVILTRIFKYSHIYIGILQKIKRFESNRMGSCKGIDQFAIFPALASKPYNLSIWSKLLLLVGLTGGIATGKSTVAAIFRRAGAFIIDADLIARDVVTPGTPAWKEIRNLFGDTIIGPDGTIKRERLGQLVFGDQHRRRQLEAIVHPRIRQQISKEVQGLSHRFPRAVIIEDIPLLLETDAVDDLEEVIVVYIPCSLQLHRLMHRDGLDENQAMQRINAQMSIEEKRKKATILIDNSGTLAATQNRVLAIFGELKRRAENV